MIIVHKLGARIPLQERNLPQEESEGVQPRQQYTGQNLLDALLPEAKVLSSYDGRVDQEQPGWRFSIPRGENERLLTEEHRLHIYR